MFYGVIKETASLLVDHLVIVVTDRDPEGLRPPHPGAENLETRRAAKTKGAQDIPQLQFCGGGHSYYFAGSSTFMLMNSEKLAIHSLQM